MLTEYLPLLPVRQRIADYPVCIPKEILDILKIGVTLRNKTTHAGYRVKEDTLKEILQAVRDLLYLLDVYAGHSWALGAISYETKKVIAAEVEARKGREE
jgi:hypothetical protein